MSSLSAFAMVQKWRTIVASALVGCGKTGPTQDLSILVQTALSLEHETADEELYTHQIPTVHVFHRLRV